MVRRGAGTLWWRRTVRVAWLMLSLALVAGCAGSAPSGPPAVNVSLIAPTDGADVGVRTIDVVGKVQPGDAHVLVSGRSVRVRSGAFSTPMKLGRRVTHIKIQATAPGFAGFSSLVTVHYVRSHSGAGSGASAPARSSGPQASAGGGSAPSYNSTEIQRCAYASGNLTGCTCLFNHLAKGGFTAATGQALVERWRRSFLATGTITYPPILRSAIVACAQELRSQG